MSQVEIGQLGLALHVLDLADEVVVEVKFAQLRVLGEALDVLDLVEGEYQCQQVGQALHALDLLDLVVEQVEVDDARDVVLAADPADEVVGDALEEAAHRDLGRQRVLDGGRARVLAELVVVLHELLDVRRDHEVVEGAFQAPHVAAVQILGRQMHIVGLVVVLGQPDGGVAEDALRL